MWERMFISSNQEIIYTVAFPVKDPKRDNFNKIKDTLFYCTLQKPFRDI